LQVREKESLKGGKKLLRERNPKGKERIEIAVVYLPSYLVEKDLEKKGGAGRLEV